MFLYWHTFAMFLLTVKAVSSKSKHQLLICGKNNQVKLCHGNAWYTEQQKVESNHGAGMLADRSATHDIIFH